MRVMHVVGARPNFMKAAPIVSEMRKWPGVFEQILVHTGQHYDDNMSRAFFEDLELPQPDVQLGIGSGTHSEQTARILIALEREILRWTPDLVVVVGDVNSTLAAALVCAKLGVLVAHVEAGLRSFDRAMPEEINRILTDQVSDFLFTTEASAERNLRREGIEPDKIHFVGNVMIDSLVTALPKAERSTVLSELGLAARQYAVLTLHRPSNVDDPATLDAILLALERLSQNLPTVFPVHPRTRKRLSDRTHRANELRMIDPLGYLDFLKLVSNARVVLTDSGGLQEETTYLGIPCLTLRSSTERPITVEVGTNRLVASQTAAIESAAREVLGGAARVSTQTKPPPLWDGRAAQRIVDVLRGVAVRRAKNRDETLVNGAVGEGLGASRRFRHAL
jgi:UDP-N-acetylglucosamine 2-epimerase (non-hydrolysing)